MKKRSFIFISILLATTIAISGCMLPNMPVYNPPVLPDLPEFEPASPPLTALEQPPPPADEARSRFTLRYDPDSTINPIFALNRDNIALGSLLYESLFILDENLVEVPLLVSEWYTEDYITFTFHILPDILMHDGEPLTAGDVTYSINQASQRGRHVNKLRGITNVSSTGELTVTITLSSPNARFVRLLDIPIIRSGTIDRRIPPGSGPFVFVDIELPPEPEELDELDELNELNELDELDELNELDEYTLLDQPEELDIFQEPVIMQLTRFLPHRFYAHMPLSTIYLRASGDGEITSLFDEGSLSLLWDDPTGAFDIRINRMHEPRFFDTTSLQFLGFNANSPVLGNYDVRRAISSSIDRQYIVENIMNVPRSNQTVASPLAISPVFDMYDPYWEPQQDRIWEMSALLYRAGLLDFNEDGFLEMPNGAGGFFAFTLDFIVNVENSHKVAAAEKIAEDLRLFGVDVNVRTLPWTNFMEALNDGDFDIFFGEIQLGADFDLSPLLLPGPNSINFGGTANTAFAPLIHNFLAASTQDEVSEAGRALLNEIRFEAPFAPILFKRHAIYSPTGVVSGNVTPSQSGVFHNFQNWIIDLIVLAEG